MTPVFCCGFECGVAGSVGQHLNIEAGTAAFSTTTVRSGSRSLRANPTAGGSSILLNTGITSSVLVCRFYVYIATMPASGRGVSLFSSTMPSFAVGAAFLNGNDNKIYARQNNINGSSGVSVTTGTWYRIDFKHNLTANPILLDVSVDGVSAGQSSYSVAATTSDIQRVLVNSTASMTYDIFIDDLIISNTLADYPIGAGYVNHFVPTSDGTHVISGANDFERTLTGIDIINSTTTAYQLIDDVPLESGSGVDWINMVAPASVNDYVECIYGPAPGISIPTTSPRAVEIIMGMHQAGTGIGSIAFILMNNAVTIGEVIYGSDVHVGTTSIIYKRKQLATLAGTPWAVAGFNGARIRFGSYIAVDANPDQYFDCTMIEAEFAPIVTRTPRPSSIGHPFIV